MPDLTGTTGTDVMRTMTQWGTMYQECAARHRASVAALLDAAKK